VETPPDLNRPLARLQNTIERYVVTTPAQRLVLALWIVHSHCVEHFEQTPYLTVTSPQRQCGKSRLLELVEQLVPRPWMTVTPSEAVIYRTIDAVMPTLLLDEVDAIFSPKTADRYEGLRAILNAGHRRGAKVPRCVGPSLEVVSFEVYCAKILAGIGTLPDTITDRSIPIRLQRKTRAEKVERFRLREVKVITEPIRNAIAAWAAEHAETLAAARPELPDELSDRMQEGCEPLLAIGDALGYGDEAREALVELLGGEREDETESAQLRMLASIRDVFTRSGAHAHATEDLLMALNADGWGNWYGRGVNPQDIAALLKPYGVRPKVVRVGDATKKGYHRDDLAQAWSRYLPVTGVTQQVDEDTAVTAVTPVTPLGVRA
jgi:hypothetical protein